MSFFHHSDRMFHIWHKLDEINNKLDVVLDRLSTDFTKEDKLVLKETHQVQEAKNRIPQPEQKPQP